MPDMQGTTDPLHGSRFAESCSRMPERIGFRLDSLDLQSGGLGLSSSCTMPVGIGRPDAGTPRNWSLSTAQYAGGEPSAGHRERSRMPETEAESDPKG